MADFRTLSVDQISYSGGPVIIVITKWQNYNQFNTRFLKSCFYINLKKTRKYIMIKKILIINIWNSNFDKMLHLNEKQWSSENNKISLSPKRSSQAFKAWTATRTATGSNLRRHFSFRAVMVSGERSRHPSLAGMAETYGY